MERGLLYVVFNKWIHNPETGEMPYKIGITKQSVGERYYGLGLKMPGEFETEFAYQLDDYEKAEKAINDILSKYHVNGEWYSLDQNKLGLIKSICETMEGEPITDRIDVEIKKETEGVSGLGPVPPEPDGTSDNKTISIKGISVPLCKNKNELTQDFVKKILRLLYNNKLIPDAELENMKKKDYCAKTFGISYPLIQDDNTKLVDSTGKSRYWSKIIFGEYYVCSQWWKQKEEIYKNKLSRWIIKIRDYNVRTNG